MHLHSIVELFIADGAIIVITLRLIHLY